MWKPAAILWLAGVVIMAAPCTHGGISFTNLYSFTGTNDGDEPRSALLQGADGNFYGTTESGGAYGGGTVFKITSDGAFTNLVSFAGTNSDYPYRLSGPLGGLVQDSDGNLYGTTWGNYYGATDFYGTNFANGTVFKITPQGAILWSVSFAGTNGAHPRAGLVQGADGNFYGTTFVGGIINDFLPDGSDGCGTVFKITPDGLLTTLYSFGAVTNSNGAALDGCNPNAGLAAGTDGNFYGTTFSGGTNSYPSGWGTVFKITTNGALTTLYSFGTISDSSSGLALDGAEPAGDLVQGADGNLYGTTTYGALNGCGTVFKMTINGTLIWAFASFGMGNGNGGNDGLVPFSGLVQGNDGNFYGTTELGGAYGFNGTLFKITADGAFTNLLSFSGTNGSYPGSIPAAALLQGSDGNFYGTTTYGGRFNYGAIFRLTVPMPPAPHATTVLYVNVNSVSPIPPYTNWMTAATTIQDAVDVALDGDQILVTNGIYQAGGRAISGSLTNRVAVTKAVTVSSVNGPAVTLIKGYQVPGITNGVGAIRCVYLTNGAVLAGFTLTNGAILGNGGGMYCESINAFASNCVVAGNSSASCGGGTYQGTLNNCIVSGNTAFIGGGAAYGTLNNCVLVSNSASYVGGGAENGILNNCTIVGNWAPSGGSGTYYSYLNNSIVYYNQGSEEAYNSISTNCCISNLRFFGIINSFSNAPVFVDLAGGNLRLQSNSPCINSGNNASVPNGPDLDGNPRVKGGTVDVGAYEFQAPGSVISYQWLQQFGLPTDGSADFVDSDGDSLNNWQEWRARTDPTDPASVLKLWTPVSYPWGIMLIWSNSGAVYFLQRSTNLFAQPAFITIQSNLTSQYLWFNCGDVPPAGVPVFYRVGVQ